jgi:hypothetical protein
MVNAAEFWTMMTSGGDFIVRFGRPSPIAADTWSLGILGCPGGGTVDKSPKTERSARTDIVRAGNQHVRD